MIKEKDPQPFNPEMEILRRRRYLKYHKLVSPFKKSGTVLDIGAAFGSGSQVFKDKGYEVSVIEPDDNKANYIKKKFNLIAESIEKAKVKNKFNVVIFSNCLEHLDHPGLALKQVRKFLKPDGLVCLEIPLVHNYVDWSDAFYLTHKSNFTEQTIQWLVQQHGFKILKTAYLRQSRHEAKSLVLLLSLGQPVPPKNFKNIDAIQKIKAMYVAGSDLKPKGILRYNVDQIEHFYYTFKLSDKKTFITFQ